MFKIIFLSHEYSAFLRGFHLQAGLALMVNPPKEGDPSYEQHESEASGIIASMRRRAHIMTDGFNACEGITCNYTEGAMYSFPRLNLPPKVRSHLKQLVKISKLFLPRQGAPAATIHFNTAKSLCLVQLARGARPSQPLAWCSALKSPPAGLGCSTSILP